MSKLAHPSLTDPHYAWFHCPGCDEKHAVSTGPNRWVWNGDAEKPSLTPSVLVRSGHHMDSHKPGDSCWCTYNAKHPDRPSHSQCAVCHSFVTDGRIQFLGDCTHALAGQTVDLPELEE